MARSCRRGAGRPSSPGRLSDVDTMHAMTIHKSQGSQATEVTVLMPPVDSRLLTRELLYTAVTRAREKVRLIGTGRPDSRGDRSTGRAGQRPQPPPAGQPCTVALTNIVDSRTAGRWRDAVVGDAPGRWSARGSGVIDGGQEQAVVQTLRRRVPTPSSPPVVDQQMFNACAEANPDRDYLIINDIRMPYGLVNMMARKTANALISLGGEEGDRVALMSPNVPQYAIAFQACAKISAIVVQVNPLAAAPEVHHYVKDSGAETIIVLAAFAGGPIDILKARDTPLRNVITFQIPSVTTEVENGQGIHDFNELVGAADDTEPGIDIRPADILMLQYTGGTTGLSKGCVLTNENLVSIGYQESYWMSPIIARTSSCAAWRPSRSTTSTGST